MFTRTPVAPEIETLSSSGDEIACCAASVARFSPRPVPSEVSRRSPMPQPGAAPQTPQEKAQDLNDMEIPTFIRRQMD
jgi:hypothetical protein